MYMYIYIYTLWVGQWNSLGLGDWGKRVCFGKWGVSKIWKSKEEWKGNFSKTRYATYGKCCDSGGPNENQKETEQVTLMRTQTGDIDQVRWVHSVDDALLLKDCKIKWNYQYYHKRKSNKLNKTKLPS